MELNIGVGIAAKIGACAGNRWTLLVRGPKLHIAKCGTLDITLALLSELEVTSRLSSSTSTPDVRVVGSPASANVTGRNVDNFRACPGASHFHAINGDGPDTCTGYTRLEMGSG
jgi:hypothetical protein